MTMKKIFSIISLVLMLVCCNFALTSCSDDDDDITNDDNGIVGTWTDTTSTEEFAFGLTLNTDGTYSYYWKKNTGFKDPNGVYVSDKEGYFVKQKGTYTVSEDKDELILKEEYGYYPYAHKNPNPEWEADDHIWEADIELQENNQVLRLNARGWLIPLKLQKVK